MLNLLFIFRSGCPGQNKKVNKIPQPFIFEVWSLTQPFLNEAFYEACSLNQTVSHIKDSDPLHVFDFASQPRGRRPTRLSKKVTTTAEGRRVRWSVPAPACLPAFPQLFAARLPGGHGRAVDVAAFSLFVHLSLLQHA